MERSPPEENKWPVTLLLANVQHPDGDAVDLYVEKGGGGGSGLVAPIRSGPIFDGRDHLVMPGLIDGHVLLRQDNDRAAVDTAPGRSRPAELLVEAMAEGSRHARRISPESRRPGRSR